MYISNDFLPIYTPSNFEEEKTLLILVSNFSEGEKIFFFKVKIFSHECNLPVPTNLVYESSKHTRVASEMVHLIIG